MSTSSSVNQVNKPILDQIVFERRVLFGCTGFIGIGIIIWLVAVFTDYWVVVNGTGTGTYSPHDKEYVLSGNSGLWRICRSILSKDNSSIINDSYNQTQEPVDTTVTIPTRKCSFIEMFRVDQNLRSDPNFDQFILSYSRTVIAFAIISLLLMCMGFLFSIYTFRNPRYMFKRLAGGIHFIGAACVCVVIEVLISSIGYESAGSIFKYPPGSTYRYGFSIYLAWFVFVILMFGGAAFMIYSKKRKGSKNATDEMGMADEPINIGR